MFNPQDILGQSFGRLTPLSYQPKKGYSCVCNCGTQTVVPRYKLVSGHTQSCGCLFREMRVTHGNSRREKRTREYETWLNLKSRCGYKRHPEFHYWGGRGITVCERWLHSFENFLEDMGTRPPNTSLDRYPDRDGPYCKENCRWATKREQNQNMRNNRLIEIDGKTLCLAEWSRISGIDDATIQHRLKIGWPARDAVFHPPLHR